MKLRPWLLCAALLADCGRSPANSPVQVVEANSPIVASGRLTQAVGIETLGGTFTEILAAGTQCPCSKSENFSTAADKQDHIDISVYRGSGATTAEATRLGRFRVVGIAPAPRGAPRISVTFALQGSDLVLSALDLQSGQPLQITPAK